MSLPADVERALEDFVAAAREAFADALARLRLLAELERVRMALARGRERMVA